MSKIKQADATSSGGVELTEKDLEKAQGGMFGNTQMMGVGVKKKANEGEVEVPGVTKELDRSTP